jgi:arylsulfatase A-like enzyme
MKLIKGGLISIVIFLLICAVLFVYYSPKSDAPVLANSAEQQTDKRIEASAVFVETAPIIVIDICSLRKDHMSNYGYGRNTTPNLDSFMKESAVFDNFWTQAGFCLPNFATLLTGTRTEVHKMVLNGTGDSKLPSSLETLAEVLKNKGFKTAGFSGSRFLSTNDHGLERGFDTFQNPFMASSMGMASFEENLPAVRNWLASNKNSPFFLYVTIDDLHAPYHADDPKLYYPEYKGIFDSIEPDMVFDRVYNGESAGADASESLKKAVEEFKKNPNEQKYLIARYDAAVKRMDRLTGELFDELKKNGLWDKSTIIVTVHQGEQLGEHDLLGHIEGLYEPIVSVPLFIKSPGLSKEEHYDQLTERIDIPATILDMAGTLQDHKQFSGKSILPLLENKNALWVKPYIFSSSKSVRVSTDHSVIIEERAVRNDRYKLIWYAYKKQPYELYDLKNDSEEKNNVVNSLPKVYDELKNQLDEYVKVNEIGITE